MAFEKGSPFVQCVNLALQEMKDHGTLDEIRRRWLADTADGPVIEPEARRGPVLASAGCPMSRAFSAD